MRWIRWGWENKIRRGNKIGRGGWGDKMMRGDKMRRGGVAYGENNGTKFINICRG